jgi:HTH-type transcriptional regulator/antitoxin HipB
MKYTTLEELTDKTFGPEGTESRAEFDQELKMELLREEIKRLRKENNLTQAQLGEKIGVQRAHISKLENNAKNITIGTLMKVMDALGAQINFTINKREQIA